MATRKTTQSTKTDKTKAEDDAAAFAERFFEQWQSQWKELLAQQAMPMGLEQLGLPPGFIPLQQIGPMGLMAPMGAVAMANLKLLQELQERVTHLEDTLSKPAKKAAGKSSAAKKTARTRMKATTAG